jgi:transketolase
MTDQTFKKAQLLRKWSLIATTEAGSGHPTSCMSAADLMSVLFDQHFTYDLNNPTNPNNDRLIFSKGHAAPLFYALWGASGAYPLEDLRTLRKFDSRYEGHPTAEFPYTDAATGSLGQGLSVGAGLAYIAKKEKRPGRTYVLLGDGELAEGQVWEAANFAGIYKLNNVVAIADINKLGQSQATMFGHEIEQYVARFRAFGFEVIAIDGHNIKEVEAAFEEAVKNETDKPYAIVAKTHKGQGVSFLCDNDNFHGKPVPKDDLEKALSELGELDDSLRFDIKKPKDVIPNSFRDPENDSKDILKQSQNDNTTHKLGTEVATREVYGSVLAELGKTNENIYALDGDVKNSTFSQDFKKSHPDRFVECFIAEQNMVSVALGMQRVGKIPFVSTFASFLTRAADQIRMSVLSKGNIKFVGSHAGVSIGEDGASQMGLEDIALFGALPDTVVLHPSDAVSTAKLIPQLVAHKGISYLRTLRPKTPVIYDGAEEFEIGGSKVLKESKKDILTLVAAGITVHEALIAHELLKKDGISVRVIDCYSVKPIDKEALKLCIMTTTQPIIITSEDHFEHGGLGDFVLDALAAEKAQVYKLAVRKVSHSGTKDELLKDAGISAEKIVEKVKELAR